VPAAIRIGCSGWSYPHWRGQFFPENLPQAEWFARYAQVFDTVELNNTFYRLPEPTTVSQWHEQAPRDFIYAVKVSRYLTHMKKLKEPRQPLRQFVDRMRGLGSHLGPLLYQLPPNWHYDGDRLRDFLAQLPQDLVHVFEFRHQSWVNDEALALLEQHAASLCVHDMSGIDVPRVSVGRIAYVRFHGTGPRYSGGYPEPTLRSWGRWLIEQSAGGRPSFAYFNNDAGAHAVADAQTLRRAVERLR
jgi:uncharacterized protein YecE (DUF72 family)